MAIGLKVGDRVFTGEEILPLLQQYGILQQLAQNLLIDQVLDDWSSSPSGIEHWTDGEEEKARQQISQQLQNQQLAPAAGPTPPAASPEAMAQRQQALLRQFKLEKFKQARWGNQAESYFLQRKTRLDRVIYSLLRVKEPALAQELYFRLEGNENTFTELATQYSQGPEANTGGLIGPADIGSCHPHIGQMLRVSKPGQLWSPIRIEEWWVVVRHEKFLPAQMDEAMQRRMVDELFGGWLQEQSQQVGILDVSNSSSQKNLWETPV